MLIRPKVKEGKESSVWVTLNRPELHNAFNEVLIEELNFVFKVNILQLLSVF
jgi:enoyl-CoA hydratase/carnithine racemase